METRTRIVLLMHPKEFRHQKCTTGRLTSLNLANSEIIPGVSFDSIARFRSLVDDPLNYPVLLYPGEGAMSISDGRFAASTPGHLRLVVFLIDATWHCSRTIARESPSLMRLPRLTIKPIAASRFVIKRQPADWCLSTIEAAHELLLALEAGSLDVYPDKGRLLGAFKAMQDFQILSIHGPPRSSPAAGRVNRQPSSTLSRDGRSVKAPRRAPCGLLQRRTIPRPCRSRPLHR